MSEGRRAYGRALRRPSTRLPQARILAPAMTKEEFGDKAERLAAALRENLRRRKAQAREAQPKKDPTQPAKE